LSRQHGEKSRGLNTGFLGLYRERKEEGREGEWELLSDSAALASFDIADDVRTLATACASALR